jgi:Flp pilus assembly protein TadD
MLTDGPSPFEGIAMDRLLVSVAAAAICALSVAGCESTDLTSADALTSPAAEANSDPQLGALAKTLPTNLDGEIRRAQLLRSQGDFAAATQSLSQLMLVAPDDARVVGEYGKVLAQQGRTQDALAFLKRAIELQPNDWMLYSALGVSYDQLDDRANARVAYEHALALKPGEPTVLNNLGVSRMLAGDLDGAQRMLTQAQAAGADFSKIQNNLQMIADMRTARGLPASDAGTALAAAKPPAMRADTKPAPASVVASAAPRPLAAVQTVAITPPAKPAAAQVVMQAVPFDPQAGPVGRRATHAPKPLAAPVAVASAATPQAAPPKPKDGVVMQAVPFDPLAGPVASAKAKAKPAAHGVASAATKPVHTAKSTVPTLRTAAD